MVRILRRIIYSGRFDIEEIFRYRATTLNQYCAELETIYEEVNIPRGIYSLHSKRAKFLEELWHKK